MLSEQTVLTDEVRLAYAEGPDAGPPLVLLHGAGNRWQNLLPLIPALTPTWHVYALDLRGHGDSGHPGLYRVDDYAHDVAAFVARVVGEPAPLFGYSLGGFAALTVAARHPELARGLVLAETPIFFSPHPMATQFNATIAEIAARHGSVQETARALGAIPLGAVEGRALTLGEAVDGPSLRAWAKSLTLVDPEAIRVLADGSVFDGYAPDVLLPLVRCPTLLMQADPARGANMRESDVARARELLRDVTTVQIPDASHGLHEDAPALVSRALVNFLTSL